MIRVLVVFLTLFISPLLQAEQESQSLDALKEKIENYVLASLATEPNSKIQVNVDPIDTRLKLKQCKDSDLVAFNPYQVPMLRANIIGIKCQGTDNRWTLYVPVKVSVQKPVLVAKHLLTRGTRISAEDLDVREVDVSQLKQGYFNKPEEIINKVCKNIISEGGTITPAVLQAESLVHKGEQVAIQALSDNFIVTMEGIALSDGAAGDMIRVKNLSSKKVIEAQVSAIRQVRVAL